MRTLFQTAITLSLAATASAALALSLGDLSNQDASSGLKAALQKGADVAVSKLGVENGFLNNDKVKIGLPSVLDKAMPILRMTGQGQKLDDLVVSMNHAAEQAVPLAKPLLLNAVKSMSVTDFFKQKTSAQLGEKFLPIVKGVTDRNGLSAQYNSVMGQVGKTGMVPAQQSTVEGYVTQRALDGLYTIIGDEEKAIRQDPVGAGSAIIGKVFGALK